MPVGIESPRTTVKNSSLRRNHRQIQSCILQLISLVEQIHPEVPVYGILFAAVRSRTDRLSSHHPLCHPHAACRSVACCEPRRSAEGNGFREPGSPTKPGECTAIPFDADCRQSDEILADRPAAG